MATGDWGVGLLVELLLSILERMDAFDQVRFACVCTRWRSTARWASLQHRPRLPWVMLPPHRDDSGDRSGTCTFTGIPTGDDQSKGPHKISLPEFIWRRCVGSSLDGWVVVLGKNRELCVVNPLTRARLLLPPIATIPEVAKKVGSSSSSRGYNVFIYHYFKKAIMVKHPAHRVLVVVLVESHDHELAFATVGDETWTAVATGRPSGHRDFIDDIAFHGGKVYGITNHGKVIACDVGHPSGPRVTFYELHDRPPNVLHQHLVSFKWPSSLSSMSTGNLWVVYRHRRMTPSAATPAPMHVVELEQAGDSAFRCVAVNDLAGHTIFLDDWCCSVALHCSEFPELKELKENCIYYTRVADHLCRLEVVNLAGQCIESHYLCRSEGLYHPTSIWVWPVLRFP